MIQVLWLTPEILATQDAEIRRIMAQGQLWQKVSKAPISTNKKLGVPACACHPGYSGRVNRRTLGINARPYSKNKAERAEGLSSNASKKD
jgi:hypothetical protein